MSRTYHHNNIERRIRVRGVKRNPKDLRRLARALIELAQAEAEAEAQAAHEHADAASRRLGPVPVTTTAPDDHDGKASA